MKRRMGHWDIFVADFVDNCAHKFPIGLFGDENFAGYDTLLLQLSGNTKEAFLFHQNPGRDIHARISL